MAKIVDTIIEREHTILSGFRYWKSLIYEKDGNLARITYPCDEKDYINHYLKKLIEKE